MIIEIKDINGFPVKIDLSTLTLFGMNIEQIRKLRRYYIETTGKYPEDF